MKTNLTYALGRTAGLVLFLAPLLMNVLPAGWENLTLGVIFHAGVTWLNEWYHSQPAGMAA